MKGFTISTTHFEGPFQVLLTMIEEKKLSVSDLTLAHIADQFFSYLETHEMLPVEELADFLYIASKLLYAKSRALGESVLPPLIEEEGEMPLADRLRRYQVFVAATAPLREKFEKGEQGFWGRIKPPSLTPGFYPPSTLNPAMMHRAMEAVLARLVKDVELPTVMVERVVTLKEKIETIKALLENLNHTKLSQIIESGNAQEVVVSFLALLELVKQNEITINQEKLFDDVHIHHYGTHT